MAEGGRVDNPEVDVVRLFDNGYIIPNEFAKEWAKSLLDRLNEDVVD